MPKKDFDIAVDEVWWILKEYNGIPSGKIDRAAYAKVSYYLKNYSDTPQIKSLIKEFNLTPQRTNAKRTSGIEEIIKILEERQRMPRLPDEEQLYHKVKYYFKKNGNDEEVKRLKMIYASGDVCPLYEKTGELPLGQGRSCTIERVRKSMKYVLDTYRIYKVFPAANTVPMKRVRSLLEHPSRFLPSRYFTVYVISEKEFSDFIGELIDLGCEDEMVINNWNILNKTEEL